MSPVEVILKPGVCCCELLTDYVLLLYKLVSTEVVPRESLDGVEPGEQVEVVPVPVEPVEADTVP